MLARALPALALFVAGSATAQSPTIVSPAAALTTTSYGANSYPFSNPSLAYQQVHSASSFSVTGPHTIQVLRVETRSLGTFPASVDLLLRMADCPHDSEMTQSTYAANTVPASDTLVFTRKTVNLPMATSASWDVSFPFDQPFQWAGGHLSWFCEVFGNSNGGMNLGRSYVAWHEIGDQITSAAPGCASALGTGVADQFNIIRSPGHLALLRGYSNVPSGGLPAALLIGGTPTSIDLTPLGATGCTLTTDVLGVAYGTTMANASGSVEFSLPIPPSPLLVGATFESQFAFLQVGANPFNLFLTNGVTNVIGRDHGLARVFGGSGIGSGNVETRYGLGIALD